MEFESKKRPLKEIELELQAAQEELDNKRRRVETLEQEKSDHPDAILLYLGRSRSLPQKKIKRMLDWGRLQRFRTKLTNGGTESVAAGCAEITQQVWRCEIKLSMEDPVVYEATKWTGQSWDDKILDGELIEELESLSPKKRWKRAMEWNKDDLTKTLAGLYFCDHYVW